MLFRHPNLSLQCLIGIYLFISLCALIAYYTDSKRPSGDPKKKNYHPLAILVAPITFPILLVLSIFFFMLRVLAYGICTVLLICMLILVRKPFILEAIQKTAVRIGDRLMEANMLIVRLFLNPHTNSR